MAQTSRTLKVNTIKPTLLVAFICLCIIYYFYHSTPVTLDAKDIANIVAHNHDSVIKDSKNRTYVNMMIFLQAGIGLTFILLPIVIMMYKNRAVLQRINQRRRFFHERQDSRIVVLESSGNTVETNPEEIFFKHLLQAHPNLTPHDLKLCLLLRQNYTSKEIAEALNITPASVNTARFRLRKKLAMRKEADLIIYLNKIA